jgi:hypothetical protein
MQAHAHHVRARPRLTHRERTYVLAGDQARQVALLLLGRAPAAKLVDAQIRVRAVREAHACRGATDLLHRDDVRQVTEPRAAEFGFHRDAEQPHLAQFRPQVARKGVVAIDRSRPRCDFALGKVAHRFAEQIDLFAEA